MKSGVTFHSWSRRVRLAAAGALVAVVPALWPFAACTINDECEDVPCVEFCGGPVVETACIQCPDGLLDNRPIRCTTTCGEEPEVFETCDQCPEGSFEADVEENVEVGCVAKCGDAALATICSPYQSCPAGTFDRMFCDVTCPTQTFFCVDHCGGDLMDVRCGPCEAVSLVDRATCPDAGADGG